MSRNHLLTLEARDCLCAALKIEPPAPDEMLGSLAAIPLRDVDDPESYGAWLYQEHQLELPVFRSPCEGGGTLLRVALQAYNRIEQVERLAALMR